MPTPWVDPYPPGVPARAHVDAYRSLTDLLEQALRQTAQRDALCYIDARLKFRNIDEMSAALAARLQSLGLEPGTRVPEFDTNRAKPLICIEAPLRRATTARTFERRGWVS